jgi:hypothetical protein
LDTKLSKYIDGQPVRIVSHRLLDNTSYLSCLVIKDGKPRASGILDTVKAAVAHGIRVPTEFQDPSIMGVMVCHQIYLLKTYWLGTRKKPFVLNGFPGVSDNFRFWNFRLHANDEWRLLDPAFLHFRGCLFPLLSFQTKMRSSADWGWALYWTTCNARLLSRLKDMLGNRDY